MFSFIRDLIEYIFYTTIRRKSAAIARNGERERQVWL